MVEAAAMHLPGGAGNARRQSFAFSQAEIECHEIERGPDPGDAGNQMRPAQKEVEPVGEERHFRVSGIRCQVSKCRASSLTPGTWHLIPVTSVADRRRPSRT